ncbi:MAG: hypothetical protein AB4290_16875 [Spirulina sp.]
MASKVFDWVLYDYLRAQINFNSNSFHCHLVTVEPASTITLVSEIAKPTTGGTYASQNLQDISNNSSNRIVQVGSGVKVVFQDPLWANLTTGDNAPLTGLVISYGYYGYDSDKVISYIEREVAGVPTPYTPDGSPFAFDLQTNGILQFTLS